MYVQTQWPCEMSSLRLGPSASAVDYAAPQLHSVLHYLTEMMKDESVRGAILNHIGQMNFDDKETKGARAGDRHGGKTDLPRAVATPQNAAGTSLAATVPSSSAAHPDPVPASAEVEQCNSATHRKEHARLTRRMASVDAEKYPEMVKLWNGNRQDSDM